ncbi:hypothetical protein WP4W18E09_42760 [Escherichia coli]|nr:hypothetical protein WP4W18E09_42760 [Escherichia coli]
MPLLDKLREQYGVGPLCSELHIAPSTYYHCQQQRHHPDKRSARAAKWHLNRSQFGIRIDHDLASISDHSLASQSITIWHASDH